MLVSFASTDAINEVDHNGACKSGGGAHGDPNYDVEVKRRKKVKFHKFSD